MLIRPVRWLRSRLPQGRFGHLASLAISGAALTTLAALVSLLLLWPGVSRVAEPSAPGSQAATLPLNGANRADTPATAGPARPAGRTAMPSPTATAAPAQPSWRRHTVEAGETLRSIAEHYGLATSTIVAANNLDNPDHLAPGQELDIPPLDGAVHRVAEGESLRQIAADYGADLAEIIAANGLSGNPDLIQPGMQLVIPGVAPDAPRSGPERGALGQTGTAEPAPSPAPTARAPERVSNEPPPAVTARYVAIVDDASGELLLDIGASERVAPASTTKIATALVALEREPDLDRLVDVTVSGSAMAARDGSSIMGLEPGRQVTLRTLLYGMMLPSGNDAAEQVALALAGSRAQFVAWMNGLVATLSLPNTHFVNPSGMDAAGHYSSAHDMALLARHAMRSETFRALAGAATYEGDGYFLRNLNRLIGLYPGADGVKIGYTRAAGRTIVASATRDGYRVYVSLMRSQDLVSDSTKLFDWVWRTFRWS